MDAVREFAVVKDAYSADYGKRPGAQISIVTASGTNIPHGSLCEFVRNSLDARNFFDHGDIPTFQRNMFGGSLGGPLRRDKSFLFGNYEGFRQTLGLSDLTLVPDSTSRVNAVVAVQPLLALWPLANGPELSTSSGKPSGIAEAFTIPCSTFAKILEPCASIKSGLFDRGTIPHRRGHHLHVDYFQANSARPETAVVKAERLPRFDPMSDAA